MKYVIELVAQVAGLNRDDYLPEIKGERNSQTRANVFPDANSLINSEQFNCRRFKNASVDRTTAIRATLAGYGVSNVSDRQVIIVF